MASANSIVLRNVSKTYRRDDFQIPVLVDLDLTVAEGEFLALMGLRARARRPCST